MEDHLFCGSIGNASVRSVQPFFRKTRPLLDTCVCLSNGCIHFGSHTPKACTSIYTSRLTTSQRAPSKWWSIKYMRNLHVLHDIVLICMYTLCWTLCSCPCVGSLLLERGKPSEGRRHFESLLLKWGKLGKVGGWSEANWVKVGGSRWLQLTSRVTPFEAKQTGWRLEAPDDSIWHLESLLLKRGKPGVGWRLQMTPADISSHSFWSEAN